MLERAIGGEGVLEVQPSLAAEDFAFFAQEVPGFYFRLGVLDPGSGSGGLHTPDFRADDGALEVGIRAMSHLAREYLARGGPAGKAAGED